MKIHRFYLPEFLPKEGQFATESPELIHQLTKVLRMKTGDTIQVFDGKGGEWTVSVNSIEKKRVTLFVMSQSTLKEGSKISLRVYLPIIKKDRLEWAAEKLTEIGAQSIVFVTTTRTLDKNLNFDRIDKILIEASEQSGRRTLPVAKREVLKLDNVLSDAGEWDADYLCIANFGAPLISKVLSGIKEGRVAFLVGPEGGFAPGEIENLLKNSTNSSKMKLVEVSLGENVLRAETAAIVGASLFLSFK